VISTEDASAAFDDLVREMTTAGIDIEELLEFARGKWIAFIEAKSGFPLRDSRRIYYEDLFGTPLADRPDFPKPIIPLPPEREPSPPKKSAKPRKYWEILRASGREVRKSYKL